MRTFVGAFLLMAAVLSAAARAEDKSDVQAMTAMMMQAWSRPDAPLQVEPIVIEGDAAVAGWTQDKRGGRALFRKRAGNWTLVLCAGAALREQAGLIAVGLETHQAAALTQKIGRAEARLPTSTVAAFDSFEGTVMMGDHDRHQPTPQDLKNSSRH